MMWYSAIKIKLAQVPELCILTTTLYESELDTLDIDVVTSDVKTQAY